MKQHLIRALYGQHTMLVVFGKTHGMASLREECQTVAVQLYTEFFRDPAKYEQTARAGPEGKRYCVMNRLFKRQAVEGIKAGRFSWSQAHAAPGS